MYLIAGLGNPGMQYRNNRHNVGFLFCDFLLKEYDFEDFKKKDNYYCSKSIYSDAHTVFIKPLTYMNLSGSAVVNALNFFKIPKENLIVIYDDMALPFGKIRVRENGSAGGHNGLKSIQGALGTDEYKRIRVGISAPHHEGDVINHVLGDFGRDDLEVLNAQIFVAVDNALKLIVRDNIKDAMNKYNGTTII
ncbi:MAG: aminoacyl-tRNA hydrolase [Spirochaetes bacterium GWB1_27_13]|nr:MAG: aminoacyl-tRNA hydrolase [Spirochaetes bacterium GWB1_27_13]